MAGENALRTVAWLIVGSHAIGVAANCISLALGDPRYSPALWLTFLLLKLAGVVAGLLLLKGRRLGAWLFAASLFAGAAVALACTGPYPALLWVGAAGVLAAVLAGFALVLRRAWPTLR